MKTADEILKWLMSSWTICHTTENLSLFTNRLNMSSQWEENVLPYVNAFGL